MIYINFLLLQDDLRDAYPYGLWRPSKDCVHAVNKWNDRRRVVCSTTLIYGKLLPARLLAGGTKEGVHVS
ncbi:MAG: hypothetical protein ACLVKJ_06865 [Acutalibacteraceae bacterium]